MASGIGAAQPGRYRPRGHSSTSAAALRPMQDLRWIPFALGAAAIAAGLGGRKKGATALALGAVAGAAAVGAARGASSGKARADGLSSPFEVERSITIGKSADELRAYWLDPRTLPQVMAGFATVRASADGRMHWKVEGPLGRVCEWDTETVERPGEGVAWRSLSDSGVSNEGGLRFHPAPAGRGTVVTLHFRFEPPGGALGEWVLELLGTTPLNLVTEGVLRRFKNLVETGEIPTTVRQPAARADTH